jgi:hypothetical protein
MDLSGGLNELTDGTDGSVDTVTGAETGPYWKSRLTQTCKRLCAGTSQTPSVRGVRWG